MKVNKRVLSFTTAVAVNVLCFVVNLAAVVFHLRSGRWADAGLQSVLLMAPATVTWYLFVVNERSVTAEANAVSELRMRESLLARMNRTGGTIDVEVRH